MASEDVGRELMHSLTNLVSVALKILPPDQSQDVDVGSTLKALYPSTKGSNSNSLAGHSMVVPSPTSSPTTTNDTSVSHSLLNHFKPNKLITTVQACNSRKSKSKKPLPLVCTTKRLCKNQVERGGV